MTIEFSVIIRSCEVGKYMYLTASMSMVFAFFFDVNGFRLQATVGKGCMAPACAAERHGPGPGLEITVFVNRGLSLLHYFVWNRKRWHQVVAITNFSSCWQTIR